MTDSIPFVETKENVYKIIINDNGGDNLKDRQKMLRQPMTMASSRSSTGLQRT